MKQSEPRSTMTKASKWGWIILMLMSALLALNGIGLYFLTATPSIFEQDTDVPMERVQQEFPTVVTHVIREGQLISTLLATIEIICFIIGLGGYRSGSRWAWRAMWVLVGMLAFSSFSTFLIDKRPDIGIFYLILAVATLVGQLLAGRRLVSTGTNVA